MMFLQKYLMIAQGTYTLITAIWALMDIDSFMAVTGPKTDIWLVKTVAALLVPIAISLLYPVFFESTFWQPFLLGCTTAIALAIIDFYYSANDVISNIYMWDGVAESVFAMVWMYLFLNRSRHSPSKKSFS